ncbi:MAG: ribosome biogenesis GTPase Der [Gammaproteobacteria bacterium]
MLPVIAIVGRPNVGKSTLFNRLTRSRNALVADYPGLTRDRQYGDGILADRSCIVIDTGGLGDVTSDLDSLMAQQAWQAVDEADVVLFLVDVHDGLTASDDAVAEALRRTGKPVLLVANKIDGANTDTALLDFHALGLGEPLPLSAAQGRGFATLEARASECLPPVTETAVDDLDDDRIRVAVAGRPNVGKSTLINRMLGAERVLTFDLPGTTRDSIFIPFERNGKGYTLIDTAGVRRRARVHEAVEKFSVIKTLQAIDAAHVVILVLDAQQEISEQDASLAGYIADKGRALVVAVNKWDGLDTHARNRIREQLDRKLPFLAFATNVYISALQGTGVGDLFPLIATAYASATRELPTPVLTDLLEQAVQQHQPPLVHGRRIKLRYAHQGGRNPPVIVIHGNQTERVPATYRRYLARYFLDKLKLSGTPVRIEFRTGRNPFKGKKNVLTTRQVKRKARLKRHVKKQR